MTATASRPATGRMAAGRSAAGPLRSVRRGWATSTALAFVVLGAALVNIALVGDQGGGAVLFVPLVLGLAELGWALVALRARVLPAARLTGPLLAVAGAAWLAVAGTSHGAIGTADAAAALLQIAGGLAVTMAARGSDDTAPRGPVTSRRTVGQLGVLLVTAFAVATIAGTGMAATPAGSQSHMPGMPAMHDGTHRGTHGDMQDISGMRGMQHGG